MKYAENTFKIQAEKPAGQAVKACPAVCIVIVNGLGRANVNKQVGKSFSLD